MILPGRKNLFSSFMQIKNHKIYFIVVLIAVSVLIFPAFSLYSKEKKPIHAEYSAENILGFAKYLISIDEFYRADVELKRLDSYYPGFVKKDSIFISELYIYYKAGRYPNILSAAYVPDNPSVNAIHSVFKTDSLIHDIDFVKASSIINAAPLTGLDRDIDPYIYKRMILSYILLNRTEEADKIFYKKSDVLDKIGFNNNTFHDLISLRTGYCESLKRTDIALISGVIPGMGYIYAGERATGVIAFILISALSATTYLSFKTGNKPIGIFLGASASFFYGGSIVGGYMAVNRNNNIIRRDMADSMSVKASLSDDREKIFNGYGVGGVGK